MLMSIVSPVNDVGHRHVGAYLEHTFIRHIEQTGFPCLAAKTAAARGQIHFFHAGTIDSQEHDEALLEALGDYALANERGGPAFQSFVALFPDSADKTPKEFEASLWQRLQRLHERDARKFDWDPSVSRDPASDHFSMSLAGHAFFVVGTHCGSERRARRTPVTAMVFNLHSQFERLRSEGRYTRFRDEIIGRDIAFQGTVNPMLAPHGEASEARQYSGRIVGDNWRCPFKPVS
jgi:FPC/CPF motif-containing protein YcgG